MLRALTPGGRVVPALPGRDVNGRADAVVAGIGQRGRDGGVQGGQDVGAGGGDVVHRARLDVGHPQREPARRQDRLDVAAVGAGLAAVPEVNVLAADAGGLLPAPAGADERAVQDHVRQALTDGPVQGTAQVRGPGREHPGDLVQVPAGGGPGDAVVAASVSGLARSRNQRSPSTACQKQVSARRPRGVPRRRRSAASSFAVNWIVSLGTPDLAR
jgi:hypothetical protein